MLKQKVSKKTSKRQVLMLISTIVVGVALVFNQLSGSQNLHSNNAPAPSSVSVQLDGIEIPAKIPNRNEIIITHTGFTISYNSDWKIPNWVAYELTDTEVAGEEPRSNRFMPDPNIAPEFSATDDDYKGSGFDRGHMAPAADMKWSKRAMKESFYFSNICPQNHNLNAGVWNSLEEQVRALATQKGSIYVVCGPIVNKKPQRIGKNAVVVPQRFFKALLLNDGGEWQAIGFLFVNTSGKQPLATYALSIHELEEISGITFFPILPAEIANRVKSQVDFSKWTVVKK
ncbi:MAG: DNA/RNA non-specific endonuclease [Bacteroidales bacterium]|jgi:endonuclease G|nr:DNA/RNA non-specific endonuclease [Bacteroidales bacterium]